LTVARDPEPIAELDAEAIFSALFANHVEFLVIGALAVAAHGYSRATKDVDIVPRPDADNLDRLYKALLKIAARPIELPDFRPEELPVQFGPGAFEHGGNWVLLTDYGRVDVMQWIPGIKGGYEELDSAALSIELPVGLVRVAGYDHVVAMKTTAGRPQDVEDLARLKGARGEA
jgi:hypothetical protein